MQIKLIFARAANGVIGKNNALPWHLPEDLAHFKQLTAGCPVVMGRRTWDSLPQQYRPLPGRHNIVVTRQPNWTASGASCAATLPLALALAQSADAPVCWIIGGAQLYTAAEPLAHAAEVTCIAQDFEGDAFAPVLGHGWTETARSSHISASGLAYSFISYLHESARSQL